MVCYGNVNILIAKVNGFTVCSLNICCVTSKHWTINVIQCLTVSGCPCNCLGYQILDTIFSKVDCLLAIAWCLWIIIHDIVNSHINIIIATYFLSVMNKVNMKNIFAVISLILIAIKVIWNQFIALLFILGNFIGRSSFKSNCLTKFTTSVFTI